MPRRRLPLIAAAALLACSGSGPGDTVNGHDLTLP